MLAGSAVKITCWFICKQDSGVIDDSPRNGKSLFLATGKGAGTTITFVAQFYLCECGFNSSITLGTSQPIDFKG